MKQIWLQIDCANETEALMTALELRQKMPELKERLSMRSCQSFLQDENITLTIGADSDQQIRYGSDTSKS